MKTKDREGLFVFSYKKVDLFNLICYFIINKLKNTPNPHGFSVRHGENPDEDTEPRVQQLFIGSYSERNMRPQGPAGAGLCVDNN
ncbi:hypothetical protein KJ854_02785 [Patescibacteria group bacterium]|nr:hypothetical protein [Patescibacteria group bacterium]